MDAGRNPALVYLASLSKGSQRVQLGALELVARLLGHEGRVGVSPIVTLAWEELRYQHTQAIRAKLADAYAPATANRVLAALRGALREAWRLQLVDRESFERAADLRPVRGTQLPAGRLVTHDELCLLFDASARSTRMRAGARDSALLAILAGGGLRRAEAAALQRADVVDDDGGYALKTLGKGRKRRLVPLARGPSVFVLVWLAIRGDAAGPFLLHVDQKDQVVREPLTGQGIRDALTRMAIAAGVAPFSPHDLRRSYISSLLDAGVDIATVQRLVGHAKVDTTSRYDRRGESVRREAAARLRFPTR